MQGTSRADDGGLVKVTVMLTRPLIEWLHERRVDSHSSLGNQVRVELAARRRELELEERRR